MILDYEVATLASRRKLGTAYYKRAGKRRKDQ